MFLARVCPSTGLMLRTLTIQVHGPLLPASVSNLISNNVPFFRVLGDDVFGV